MDGRVPDEGGIAELTIAWMLGKPAVIFHNDLRSLAQGINNPLVMGRADFIEVNDYEKIPLELKQRREELAPHTKKKAQLPAGVLSKIKEGELLWHTIQKLRANGADSATSHHQVAELIVQLYGGATCQNMLSTSQSKSSRGSSHPSSP